MKINVAFNRDCMEAMKEFPDKFFDLAVVDPPYGDGCSQIGNVERERESYNRFGQRFDRYKLSTDLDSTERTRTTSEGEKDSPHKWQTEGTGPAGLVERGRRNSEKNHRVGRCPETGIL